MPGAVGETVLAVEGLRELQRAFSVVNREVGKDLRAALESAAQPVRFDAEQLAQSEISGMRRSKEPAWWRMRVGVTRGSVYVAPVQRGVKTNARQRLRRPNLKVLLLGKALDPALEANKGRVEQELGDALDDMARMWEQV